VPSSENIIRKGAAVIGFIMVRVSESADRLYFAVEVQNVRFVEAAQ
jgi:hypothetical protein